jgi:hypothetical protein
VTRVTQLRDPGALAGPAEPLVAYEALGDQLSVPRRLAAAYVAQSNPDARAIVDVGSFQGELLEAFLDEFPRAAGQWTDAGEFSLPIARRRLARFGDRVSYRIGCPGRDLGDGAVPKGTDVLVTSWISSHRSADRLAEVYSAAGSLVAPGGWFIHLEHLGFADPAVERRVLAVREEFHVSWEGPPAHHEGPIATLEDHLRLLREAGFVQVDIPWLSLATCLFAARMPEGPTPATPTPIAHY